MRHNTANNHLNFAWLGCQEKHSTGESAHTSDFCFDLVKRLTDISTASHEAHQISYENMYHLTSSRNEQKKRWFKVVCCK